MRNPALLTGLKKEIEQCIGRPLPASYRRLYTMAIDGVYPAEQINNRWHYDRANVPVIVEKVIAAMSGAA